RMDQTIHLFSQQASPGRDGRGRNWKLPLKLSNRISCQRLYAEPGSQRAAVSLPGNPTTKDRVYRRSNSRPTTKEIACCFDERRGEKDFWRVERHALANGDASLRCRPSAHGMLSVTGQRYRLFSEPNLDS